MDHNNTQKTNENEEDCVNDYDEFYKFPFIGISAEVVKNNKKEILIENPTEHEF